ncbi:hypothetical protein U1Q18_004382 [Sarracenia purpurea var. burkii]
MPDTIWPDSILLPTGGSCGWFLGSTTQPIGSICGFTPDAAANRFVCALDLNSYAICCFLSRLGQIWAFLVAFAFSSLGQILAPFSCLGALLLAYVGLLSNIVGLSQKKKAYF